MQNFLGSLRSPALFNIILNIALLKNLENNTCSYILSSFYMVATGEGNFDMKMQDFWTLKSLNCRSFRGASPPRPPPGLRPGADWGPRRSPDPSPNFPPPSNPKTWIRACLMCYYTFLSKYPRSKSDLIVVKDNIYIFFIVAIGKGEYK